MDSKSSRKENLCENVLNELENETEESELSKEYHRLRTGFNILQGFYGQSSKLFGCISRGKQSSSSCIVASVYNKIIPACSWLKKDINRILELGDKLYRTSVMQIPLKASQVLQPHCVFPTFYIGHYKITAFVGDDVLTGEHTLQNPMLPEIFLERVPEILNDHCAVILNFHDKNYAYWRNKESHYFFCPEGANDEGHLMSMPEQGKAFVLRTQDANKLPYHLASFIYGKFSIYSVRILKIIELKRSMSGLIAQVQCDHSEIPSPDEIPEIGVSIASTKEVIPSGYKRDIEETSKSFDIMNTNYKCHVEGQGCLLHSTYEKDPEVVIFDNLAALLMLNRMKSFSWSSQTIVDILSLAQNISDSPFDIDTHIAGEMELIAYDKSYKLEFEKIVFGQVVTDNDGIPTIRQGLDTFFKNYDTGIIDGPQNVAIWKEQDHFFLFDPKERDALGRKWTKTLSKELEPLKKSGGACVCWYKNVGDMAEKYISNVSSKHRKDPFRIMYVDIIELPKGEDWNDWKLIATDEWLLRGNNTICKHISPNDETRKGKLLTLACYTMGFLGVQTEDEWTEESLDKLLADGIDFYKSIIEERIKNKPPPPVREMSSIQENVEKPQEEIETIDALTDVKRLIAIDGKKVLLTVEECFVSGKCTPNPKNESSLLNLKSGIERFFESFRFGVITTGDHALPIWSNDGAFYLLDCSEKANIGETMVKPGTHTGNITSVRFAKLSDMIDAITSNVKYLGGKQFCISRVESNPQEEGDVPLRNYEAFLEKAAILRKEGFHEGHLVFGLQADKQTMCNLMTALCFSLINKSAEWSQFDLVDILRIGDKLYSKIAENFTECEIKDKTISLDELRPEIGIAKFSFSKEENQGILKKVEELPPAASREDSNAPKDLANPENIQGDGTLQPVDMTANREVSLDDTGEKSSEEPVPEPDTLEIILQNHDSKATYFGILYCESFEVAIWKQDELYFLFDPKSNNEKGYPSDRRIQKAKMEIEARIKEENERKAAENAQDDDENISERQAYYSLDEVNAQKAASTKQINDGVGKSQQELVDNAPTTEQPIEKQKSIDLMSLPNDGSAYVAWFQTLDGLLSHIISKVPREYQNREIKWNVLQIKSQLPRVTNTLYKNFEERSSEGFWILRASISQDDNLLPNRTLLDGSSSIIALAFTKIAPADDWSTTILDIILKYADRLYSKSLTLTDSAQNTLTPEQLAKSFSIYKSKFDHSIKSTGIRGTLNNPDQYADINPILVENLNKIGSKNNVPGIIVNLNENYRVTIWKNGSNIYVFDSHKTDPDGKLTNIGVASLSRFSNNKIFFKSIRQKFGNLREAINFEIYEVEMDISQPGQDATPKHVVNNLNVPINQSAFVRRSDPQSMLLVSHPRKEEQSEILTNISAIILSHLLHTECWTPTILNKLFSLTNNLAESSKDIKVSVTSDKVEMDLKGLIRCFTIDGIICTLSIDEIIRGPIVTTDATDVTLLNSLTLFMRNYCRAIVITNAFVCALWRELDTYYLFNAATGKNIFVLSADNLDVLYDWMIEHRKKDDFGNWYEIIRVEIASVHAREFEQPKKMKPAQKKYKTESTKGQPLNQVYGSEIRNFSEGAFDSTNSTQLMEVSKRENAACIVAAAMTQIKDISKWKKDILDAISRSALLLYMDSISVRGTLQIDIVDMEKFFQLENVQMQVEALPSTKERPTKDNITEMLAIAFHRHKTAYLITSNGSMLAARSENKYYLFDPEKITQEGRYIKPSVLHFQSFEELVSHLAKKIGKTSEKVSFGAIKVFPLK